MLAKEELGFAKTASHVSDVQFRHTLSPDNKANSILFDNFTVRVDAGEQPVAVRTLSVVYPLTGVTNQASIKCELRGAVELAAGGSGTVIFRALGRTHVLEPLCDPSDPQSGAFTKELVLTVPAGRSLDMTFILVAERGGASPDGTALVTLDSVDLAIGK